MRRQPGAVLDRVLGLSNRIRPSRPGCASFCSPSRPDTGGRQPRGASLENPGWRPSGPAVVRVFDPVPGR
jgi:hypothetical protein